MAQTGVVKFFNGERGYGFIKPDDGARDVFVHITAVEQAGMKSLTEGQRISFDVEPDKKGKGPKAVNVTAIRSALNFIVSMRASPICRLKKRYGATAGWLPGSSRSSVPSGFSGEATVSQVQLQALLRRVEAAETLAARTVVETLALLPTRSVPVSVRRWRRLRRAA